MFQDDEEDEALRREEQKERDAILELVDAASSAASQPRPH